MLVAIREDMAQTMNLTTYTETWRSDYDQIESKNFAIRPSLAPKATHFGANVLTVRHAIDDLGDRGYRRLKVLTQFASEMRNDRSWMSSSVRAASSLSKSGPLNHNKRNHSDPIIQRFKIYHFLRDEQIHPKVFAIPKTHSDRKEEGQRQLIKEKFAHATFPAKAGKEVIANDLDEMVDHIMKLGTKKHSQRPLHWDKPSPTVVSLPDDYVHPSVPRTLTVRELARFQSFPDAFEFRAKETTGGLNRRVDVPQYTQVGNAVPPKLAYAVGAHIHAVLLQATSQGRPQ